MPFIPQHRMKQGHSEQLILTLSPSSLKREEWKNSLVFVTD